MKCFLSIKNPFCSQQLNTCLQSYTQAPIVFLEKLQNITFDFYKGLTKGGYVIIVIYNLLNVILPALTM